MILISNLVLSVSDGSTIASTEVYSATKKVYINIGSGNVFKLSWNKLTLTNDTVDRYNLVIKRYDTVINEYYDILEKNIGLVNEFYVDSDLLRVQADGRTLPEQYMLSIYLEAYSKLGDIITSNVVNPYVSKGTGTYVKVEAGYPQPIMKRALAFAKISQPATTELLDSEGKILKDVEGKTLFAIDTSAFTKIEAELTDRNGTPVVDATGETLFADATKTLVSISGWGVLLEGYTKDAEGNWHTNDIRYEVLTDQYGEIIYDMNNKPIYIY